MAWGMPVQKSRSGIANFGQVIYVNYISESGFVKFGNVAVAFGLMGSLPGCNMVLGDAEGFIDGVLPACGIRERARVQTVGLIVG